jgi:hypothetical protein
MAERKSQDVTGGEEARLRKEIERTRSQMTGTVQAIQDRLSLNRFLKPALRNLGQAIAGGSATWVETVRRNPIPVSLMGASLGWLLLKGQAGAGAPPGRAPRGARGEIKDVARGARDLLEQRPLVLGAACVAVGLALGLALPAPRAKERLTEKKARPGTPDIEPPPDAAPV